MGRAGPPAGRRSRLQHGRLVSRSEESIGCREASWARSDDGDPHDGPSLWLRGSGRLGSVPDVSQAAAGSSSRPHWPASSRYPRGRATRRDPTPGWPQRLSSRADRQGRGRGRSTADVVRPATARHACPGPTRRAGPPKRGTPVRGRPRRMDRDAPPPVGRGRVAGRRGSRLVRRPCPHPGEHPSHIRAGYLGRGLSVA